MSSFFQYISADDLRQEAYAWLSQHPERVERLKDDNPGTAAAWLRGDIIRFALKPAAQREKAYYSGYEVRDQYEYSARAIRLRGLIAQCLTAIVTGTREQEVRPSEGPSGTDPAESSMNFVVAMADIEKGWNQLHADHQKLLAEYFVYGKTSPEMAAEYRLLRQDGFRWAQAGACGG
jgi:hypothetical protein